MLVLLDTMASYRSSSYDFRTEVLRTGCTGITHSSGSSWVSWVRANGSRSLGIFKCTTEASQLQVRSVEFTLYDFELAVDKQVLSTYVLALCSAV